jgi:hypothetical protein
MRSGRLQFRQMKTNIEVNVTVLEGLRAVLDESKSGNLTFLVTEYGASFTAAVLETGSEGAAMPPGSRTVPPTPLKGGGKEAR